MIEAPQQGERARPVDGVTMLEMSGLCLQEARRIEIVQQDLVDTGLRTAPDPGQLRRQRIYEGIVHLIDLVRGDRIMMERLRRYFAVPPERAAGGGAP